MTRTLRLRIEGACLLLGLAVSSSALAQDHGFSLDRFEPAERGSDWFAGESLDLRGDPRPALGVTLDWAHKPLVIYDSSGRAATALVQDQLFAHVGASFTLADRVRIGANLPIALWQDGHSGTLDGVAFTPTHGTTIGDLRLGADVRLLGEYGDAATLAIGLQAHLPSGSRDAYTGDGKVRLTPRLMLAGDIAVFAYSARVGFDYRAQDQALGNVPTGSELQFVTTAGLRLADRKLLLGPELWGTTVVGKRNAAFKQATTPFELLFGAHYRVPDWSFGLGVGPGLTRGLGSPAVRVLASIDWQPDVKKSEPPPPPAPPPPPPPPPAAEPPPPPDRDDDGISDDEDACPDTRGVHSDDARKNGCPPDRDGDGVVDSEDACPDEPGELSEDPHKNGCPKARVEQGQIKILERIEFKTGSAELLESSTSILEAVRSVLHEHGDISKLSIEGHTDNVGKAAYNQSLSQRRAASVRAWLVAHGIDGARLTSKGFGMSQPIDDNATPDGREHNRRVEFHIQEQSGKPAPAGGSGAEIEEN